MRVFITGASGFVGAHLTQQALEAGHEVMILAMPGDPLPRLQSYLTKIHVVYGLLSDRSILAQLLDDHRPDVCIHLAWYAEPGKYLYSPENIPSLINSIALLEELIRVRCQQVIMVGTCAEYDTEAGLLRENSPTRPTTIYAATKLSLSVIGEQLAFAGGIRFAWARLFYLYGSAEDERRMVPALIKSLLRGNPFPATQGEQVRDYLHVEDVASALLHLAEHGLQGTFNISSSDPVTIRRLMEIIGDLIGRTDLIQFGSIPYRQWEPMFICGDNSKLRQAGWKPRYTLREGLTSSIEWWKARSES